MIDSSKRSVLKEGLKNIQGKPIVNSISLKEGEDEFIKHGENIRPFCSSFHKLQFPWMRKATFTVSFMNIIRCRSCI